MGNPRRRKGHPPRLATWDYSSAGGYFVTFQVKDRISCLSRVEAERTCLTLEGKLVEDSWLELPHQFPGLILDQMVVMPDHVHAVLFLPGGALINQGPTRINQGPHQSFFILQAPHAREGNTLGQGNPSLEGPSHPAHPPGRKQSVRVAIPVL